MPRKQTVALGALAASVAFAACLSGCASSKDKQLAQIYHDPTPALETRTQRSVDLYTDWAYNRDTELRMVIEDINRAMYTDRPTAMHPGPRPY